MFSQLDISAEDLPGTSRIPGGLQQALEPSRVNETWPNPAGQAGGRQKVQHEAKSRSPKEERSNIHC